MTPYNMTPRKNYLIQIRTSAETKAILNRVEKLRSQRVSEFMLESTPCQAEDTILDQRTFFLDNTAHVRFMALLEASSKPSAKVRCRLNSKAPWK
jgi:uncharacterized protein (DUF1778 family)